MSGWTMVTILVSSMAFILVLVLWWRVMNLELDVDILKEKAQRNEKRETRNEVTRDVPGPT